MTLTADFEKGIAGNNVTTAAGEASLSAWTAVFGTAPKYSSSSPAHGSLCADAVSGASARLHWTTTSGTDMYGRFYLWSPSIPTGTSRQSILLFYDGSGTQTGGIYIAQASAINSGCVEVRFGTTSLFSSVAAATGQWIRIGYHIFADAASGTCSVSLYNTADSATPDSTISWGSGNTGASIGQIEQQFGWNTADTLIDQCVAFATASVGPFPVISVAPTVNGSAPVGSTLACDGGTWNGTFTLGYQWTRDGANIGGATSSTYVTQVGDVSHAIGCTVTATGQQATNESASQASSNTVTPTSAAARRQSIGPSIAPSIAPSISGR